MFFRLYGDTSLSFVVAVVDSIAEYNGSKTEVLSVSFLKYNKEEGIHLIGFTDDGEDLLAVDVSEYAYNRDITLSEFLDILKTPLDLMEKEGLSGRILPSLALEFLRVRDTLSPVSSILH